MTVSQELIGVDIAKRWIDVHHLRSGARRRVPADAKSLTAFARDMAQTGALIVYEASGGHERPLAAALDGAGAARVRVNARQARDFARATGRLAKHAPGMNRGPTGSTPPFWRRWAGRCASPRTPPPILRGRASPGSQGGWRR